MWLSHKGTWKRGNCRINCFCYQGCGSGSG